ncbi:MAG: SDR family NAD(P)-dependent oxidoreductase [Alphaproteobacteria bacterium]|nr:SDR family NAD(P)-dependent oxidoreductase [Alphaproteobacteria bacterium]
MTPRDGLAWVTGASSGIGAAVALLLVRQGWRVVVTARRESELQHLADAARSLPGAIHVFPADVTDQAAIRKVVEDVEEAMGPLTLAILNAGVYLPVDGLAPDPALFERSFAVNVLGTANALGAVVPKMVARQKGQIAIVASVTGYGGLPTSAAYGATKAALINMAESLWFDLNNAGVRIQIVNPGFVKTPATDQNDFDMPYLMGAEEAARRLVRGLKRSGFEITFPRRFTYQLKALQFLPYWLYFRIVGSRTR